MDREHLRQQIATMRQSMFDDDEGILDQHFIQLEQLERDGIPDFAEDLTAVYFRDTIQRLAFVEEEMEKTSYDFEKVERRLYQLKGSSASIGAIRVKNAVKQALQFFHEGNIEGFKASFRQLKREHEIVKTKLDSYFQLLNQLESAP